MTKGEEKQKKSIISCVQTVAYLSDGNNNNNNNKTHNNNNICS